MDEKKILLSPDLFKTTITVSVLDPSEATLALKLLTKIKVKKSEIMSKKSSNP